MWIAWNEPMTLATPLMKAIRISHEMKGRIAGAADP